MPNPSPSVKSLYAALECEPGVNLHRYPIALRVQGDQLLVEGEVESVAVKRRVIGRVARLNGTHRIVDRLQVATRAPHGDGAIRDAVARHLAQEPVFRRCILRACNGSDEELLAWTADADGDILIMVENGVVTLTGEVISLSHQRLAGVLAWWAPGTRDVVNNLRVVPAEVDSDDEISDALRIVLEKDPLVHAAQIGVRVRGGTALLAGLVATEEERRMAEHDAWCVGGVREVVNRIEVGAGAGLRAR